MVPSVALADEIACSHCEGVGQVPVYVDCTHCDEGVVTLVDGSVSSCPYCFGGGYVIQLVTCPVCDGSCVVDCDDTQSEILQHVTSLESAYVQTNQTNSETEDANHDETMARIDSLIRQVSLSGESLRSAVGSTATDYEYEGERTSAVVGFGSFLIGFVGLVPVGLILVSSLFKQPAPVGGDE